MITTAEAFMRVTFGAGLIGICLLAMQIASEKGGAAVWITKKLFVVSVFFHAMACAIDAGIVEYRKQKRQWTFELECMRPENGGPVADPATEPKIPRAVFPPMNPSLDYEQ